MSKLLKGASLPCFIYDMDLRSLAEEPDLGFGKDLSAKVDFVLVDSPYNVRRVLK